MPSPFERLYIDILRKDAYNKAMGKDDLLTNRLRRSFWLALLALCCAAAVASYPLALNPWLYWYDGTRALYGMVAWAIIAVGCGYLAWKPKVGIRLIRHVCEFAAVTLPKVEHQSLRGDQLSNGGSRRYFVSS